MKTTKKIIAFALCFVLVASIAVTAYAIDYRATVSTPFREGPGYEYTWIGNFKVNDILRVFDGTTGTNGHIWYQGYPDVNTDIYKIKGLTKGWSDSAFFSLVTVA